MDFIKKALYFSAEQHDGQYRKGGKVPFIAHPVLVALGIRNYTNDEEIIAAAILHDILEDCPSVSLSALREEFGDRVAGMVADVTATKENNSASWRERKELYLEQVKTASEDALLILAMDKMVNMQGYFDAVRNRVDGIEQKFKGTFDDYVWYYSSVGEILYEILKDHPIVLEYNDLLESYK